MNFLNAANIDLGIASELGLPVAAGERAGRERKTACEILGTDFYAVKGGRLCQSARSQRRVPSQRVTRARNYF